MTEKKKSKRQKKKDVELKIAEYMQELRELQLRKGKKAQSSDEQMEHLRRIADCIMFSVEIKTLSGEMTGVAALMTALQRVNEEIAKTLKLSNGDEDGSRVEHVMTYEFELPKES